MRKMKKINGFLVVRFNDREKRDNPTLGSFGVIDGSQYTGDLDFDLDAFEYTDADLIEIAVEQARGLDAEEDFSEEAPTYTVAVESAEGFSEEEVYPKAMTLSWAEQLKTQIKSKHYPDVDPRTAAHELAGYKTALRDLGLLDADEEVTEPGFFGEACEFLADDGHRVEVMLPSKAGLAILSPHDFEEGETYTGCTVQALRCRRCGMESFAWSKEPSPEQEEALAYVPRPRRGVPGQRLPGLPEHLQHGPGARRGPGQGEAELGPVPGPPLGPHRPGPGAPGDVPRELRRPQVQGGDAAVKQPVTTKEARAFMEELRRELLRQKRAVGDPRAPMRARPGQEEAFERVEANLARAELILKLLAMEALRTEKRKAVKAVDALLDGFIVFGLASAAMLGVAAAAVLLNAPSPVVQATAIIGVGVALARAVARK